MSMIYIKERLASGEYNSSQMVEDINYLLAYADRSDRVIAEALISDGESSAKIKESVFTLVQNDLLRERNDHEMTKQNLSIAKKELRKLNEFIRSNRQSSSSVTVSTRLDVKHVDIKV